MENPYQSSATSAGAVAPLRSSAYFKNPRLLTVTTRIFLCLGVLVSLGAGALALTELSLMEEYSPTDGLDDVYDDLIIPTLLLD